MIDPRFDVRGVRIDCFIGDGDSAVVVQTEVCDRKTARVAAHRRSPKGRNAGAKHGMSVLTDENVYEIRDLFATGVPTTEIAERYGISRGHARDIGSLRRWKHLPIKPTNSDE